MKNLTYFTCDKGSLVINGVCFRAGNDGEHKLYFCDDINKLHKNFEIVRAVWFDLRDTNLYVQLYDCDKMQIIKLDKEYLDCLAVQIAKDHKGNFCLVKYF